MPWCRVDAASAPEKKPSGELHDRHHSQRAHQSCCIFVVFLSSSLPPSTSWMLFPHVKHDTFPPAHHSACGSCPVTFPASSVLQPELGSAVGPLVLLVC